MPRTSRQPRGRRLPSDVSPEKFVRTWCESEDVSSVAAFLGMDKRDCSAYAGYLRMKGVPLKKFQNVKAAGYAKLADIVTEYNQ